MAAIVLKYSIAKVSSEEEECSASELLSPGPDCKGWATDKYCMYPQELTLQLKNRAAIDRIQFLSHSQFIPKSVSIEVGDVSSDRDNPDLNKAIFMPVGDISFLNGNEKGSIGRGRQLQTVEFGGGQNNTTKDMIKVTFVKFILKQNHFNRQNQYNQVSLMGITIYGIEDMPNHYDKLHRRRNSELEQNSVVARQQDLAFVMYIDKDIAELIHQLENRKYEAVSRERFENARRLKVAIKEMETVGQVLAALEMEKRALISSQDYEGAKTKKTEIEDTKDEAYRKYAIAELLEMPSPSLRRSALGQSPPITLPPPVSHKSRPSSPLTSEDDEMYLPPQQPPRPTRKEAPLSRNEKPILPKPPPAPIQNNKKTEGEQFRVMDPDRKELQMAINIYSDNVIARALNKSPAIKEKACKEIKETLASYSESNSQFKPAQMLKGTTQIVARLIRDKVWAIFGHGVALTTSMYENFIFAYPLPRKELAISVEKILKELLARGCDTTERVMDKAEATLEMMLQNKKVSSLGIMQQTLSEPLSSSKSSNPKMALVRAELMKYIIDELIEVVGEPPLSIVRVAEFALSAVNHSLQPVKRIGEKIMLRMYEIDARRVRKIMPPDTPKSRKINHSYKYLYEAFQRRDQRSAVTPLE